MKYMRKILSLTLALIMVLAMATTAFAQTVDSEKGGSAKITINNAAKGATYKVVKLFDATVTGTEGGSIAYTGDIPEALGTYFSADENGYISATDAAKKDNGELSDAAVAAMKTWAEAQNATASATSEGGALEFTNLEYDYYVVLTSQGSAAITVVSTNPDASIYDKNSTAPGAELTKTADDTNVSIGDTVTYTVSFKTANYDGAGEDAKKIVSYTITDTLPAFLTDVTVKEITIGGTAYKVNDATPQFSTDKAIEIPWVGDDGNSLYANGAEIKITYTAKVANVNLAIDGEGNTNAVSLTWECDDGTTGMPGEGQNTAQATIHTYALALKKVDESGAALAGAKFAVKGLTVTGSNGYYTVTAYDATATENGTEMECDDEGNLVIVGLDSDVEFAVTETVAPNGYNRLNEPVNVKPQMINKPVTVTKTTVYYDENGVETETATDVSKTTIDYTDELEAAAMKVENKAGSVLPETGGMGTTLFYALGGIMVLAAVVLLVTKKRMGYAD